MNIESINELLKQESHNQVFDLLKSYSKDITAYAKQYDPKLHDIHNLSIRKDKVVFKPNGEKQDGELVLHRETVKVARISLAIQKQIVKCAAGILCGNPIKLDSTEDISKVQEVWDNNKLDFKSKKLAKLMMSETECAELWYKKGSDYKMMVLAPSLGDSLYPVFDETGDMIAFARTFEVEVFEGGRSKKYSKMELYTEKEVWTGDNSTGTWKLEKKTHGFSKIPIVYYSQPYPEWHDVQEMIERLEILYSNNADTNDYFGSPTAVASGNIVSYADKGEAGKMVQLDNGAKMEYLTWDQVPEAIKLEAETLIKNIYSLTATIDFSPDSLGGTFGSAPSNYVVKILFTDAHMKAAEHEEKFGESIQRRINLIKSFTGLEKANIKPKFTYFLPKNTVEEVNTIVSMYGAGIISLQTALELNPLVKDAIEEMKRINPEDKKEDDDVDDKEDLKKVA